MLRRFLLNLLSPPLGVLVIAVLLNAAFARAAGPTWIAGNSAGSCGTESEFQQAVQARVRDSLDVMQLASRIEVHVTRSGRTWVARIVMRDVQDRTIGERTLSLTADDCQPIQNYAALTVSLLLQPDVEISVSNSPPASLKTTPAAAREAEPEKATSAAEFHAATERSSRISGSSPDNLLLFPVRVWDPLRVFANEDAGNDAKGWGELFTAALRGHLLAKQVFTIVEPARGFNSPSERDGFILDATRGASPAWPSPSSADRLPLGVANTVLIPELEVFAVQRGLDFTVPGQPNSVAVTLRLSIRTISRARHIAYPLVVVANAFSVHGSTDDPGVRQLAIALAARRAAEEVMAQLRPFPPFRLRPRIASVKGTQLQLELPAHHGAEEGDTFVFESTDGETSGFVVLDQVKARSAVATVKKTGAGSRLSSRGKYAASIFAGVGYAAYRLGYGEPSAATLERAGQSGRSPPELGRGADFGVDLSLTTIPRTNPLRGDFHFRLGTGLTTRAGYYWGEVGGGLGLELPVAPTLGLSWSPLLRPGVALIAGSFDNAKLSLEPLLAGTLSLGARALLRRARKMAVLIGGEYQKVIPLHASTPSSAFLDNRYPSFDGIVFYVGVQPHPVDDQ